MGDAGETEDLRLNGSEDNGVAGSCGGEAAVETTTARCAATLSDIHHLAGPASARHVQNQALLAQVLRSAPTAFLARFGRSCAGFTDTAEPRPTDVD